MNLGPGNECRYSQDPLHIHYPTEACPGHLCQRGCENTRQLPESAIHHKRKQSRGAGATDGGVGCSAWPHLRSSGNMQFSLALL